MKQQTKKEAAFTPLCPVAKRCAGCQMQNLPYKRQLQVKQGRVVRLLGRFHRVSPIIGMDNPLHYRCKIQSAFTSDRSGRILSGVYQSSTGKVVAVDSCLIEDRRAAPVLTAVRGLMREMKLQPYDSATGRGLLRHVLVRVGFFSGQIMVVLVTGTPIFPLKKRFAAELVRRCPQITTVVMNINRDYDGLMLGPSEQVLYGPGAIEDTLCGRRFRISPRSFYQVNPVQTQVLYEKAVELARLDGTQTVLDAYCGTGTIGIVASGQAGQVIGVEQNPDAVKDAVGNARRNGVHNAAFFQGDAGLVMQDLARSGGRLDVVFLDPPRAGADRRFLSSLLKAAPERIVYISCNPDSLARDLQVLRQAYAVQCIQPVDLFPFTNNVECIAALSKR